MKKARGKLLIRPLTAAEIPEMIEVWKASGLPYKPKGRDSLKNLKTQWNHDKELFLGAFSEAKLVGVVLASDDGRRAWINRLAVIPDARRLGVALALVVRAEKVMRSRGRRLFCVQIEEGNGDSTRFFEEAGYKREDEIFYFTKRELKSY
ncbi:MAG: hypothetical protein A3K60_08585 [Euryarchaeota archaeon RBG_19FT_COMBO_56_21]|nr:MAG: hypothetical protein A3K60_08585 [Euryarchaeota archaeon RBG_19FT_COMBO_56_21]